MKAPHLSFALLTKLVPALCLLVATLVVLYPINPSNMTFMFPDSGVFLYIGSRILRGEVPYGNIWENKPPIIFYLDALGLAVSDGSRWGVWGIEVAAIFAAAIIGFRLMKDAFGRTSAIIGSALWLSSLTYVLQGGNLTEEYVLPLQFSCLWLATLSEQNGACAWRSYLIGILLGLAFFLKQNTIGIGFAIAFYLIFTRLYSRQFHRLANDLLPLLVGGMTVSALVVFFFARQSALLEFWDNAFLYNFAYPQLSNPSAHLESIFGAFDYLSKNGLAYFALLGWGIGLGSLIVRSGKQWNFLVCLAVIDLPIEWVLASLPGNSYGHYYMPLLPACAILAAGFCSVLLVGLRQPTSSPRHLGTSYVSPLILITSIGLTQLTPLRDYVNSIEAMRNLKTNHIVDYIQRETSPSDCVLLWGFETRINFLAQRCSPTRFTYQAFPLHTPGYSKSTLVEEFLGDIERHKPRLIIETQENGFLMDQTGFTSPEIDRLLAFVKSSYQEKDDLGSWVIYSYVGP